VLPLYHAVRFPRIFVLGLLDHSGNSGRERESVILRASTRRMFRPGVTTNDGTPIVKVGTLGDISVTRSKDLSGTGNWRWRPPGRSCCELPSPWKKRIGGGN
jgi:hypothetical protein